ncbi:MAG: hypothetical protein JXQ71_17985 [Verrucomicrobia bacterium]|nr:hypothetical protein [Verrucomicrobiota bacterium]
MKKLFHYAQSRGYLPKGPTQADDLRRCKETPNPISIYTTAEMAKLLERDRSCWRVNRGQGGEGQDRQPSAGPDLRENPVFEVNVSGSPARGSI